jgi:hypothetical protein
VLPSRELIPLEGSYRVEEVDGEWYVLGRHQATACESEAEARQRLEERRLEHDAHALAAQALEGLPIDYEVVAERA